MRRKDRQMDKEFALKVIDESQYASLGLVTDTGVMLRVLSVVRKDSRLYFHSATKGSKVDAFKDGQEVELTFVARAQVPNLFSREEIKELIDQGQASQLLSKVFTSEFSSAMVRGSLRRVTDKKEIEEALRIIGEKYTPDMMEFIEIAVEISRDRVAIFAVEIEDIMAKRKMFDDEGEEMKWGRKS
ncbi:MAG: pyridoxamine 5'-phosphate oxidase family protein [Tissierellia bacterium]|nr:pyridoxamine 5'-phosphate oxidase family protein [Tissierellia bacterium]